MDPEIQKHALERYLFLLNQIAEYDSVEPYCSYSGKKKKKNVKLDIERFNNFSGLSLKASKAILVLKNLGFKVHARSEKNVTFNIPSHRFDISLDCLLYTSPSPRD